MTDILILALGKSDSGTAIYAGNIVKEFPLDSNIDLFVSKYSDYDWTEISHRFRVKRFRTYRNNIEFLLNSLVFYPLLLIKIIFYLALGKYDTIYVPYFHHWEIFILKIFRLFKKNIIYTVHDGIMHGGESRALDQYIIFSSIRAATKIVFLTNYVQTIVKAEVKFHGTSYVIPHGIISLPGVLESKPLSIPPKILFIGRISRYKGVELLFDLKKYLRHKDIVITIAGKSNYPIDTSCLGDIIFIDKWLSESEVVSLLNNSDILILPYLEATQSGVVTLAIDAQIPVVVTDVGGLREQFESAAPVFVEPNTKSIASGVDFILDSPSEFHSIQKQLSLIKESITWGMVSKKIVELF